MCSQGFFLCKTDLHLFQKSFFEWFAGSNRAVLDSDRNNPQAVEPQVRPAVSLVLQLEVRVVSIYSVATCATWIIAKLWRIRTLPQMLMFMAGASSGGGSLFGASGVAGSMVCHGVMTYAIMFKLTLWSIGASSGGSLFGAAPSGGGFQGVYVLMWLQSAQT